MFFVRITAIRIVPRAHVLRVILMECSFKAGGRNNDLRDSYGPDGFPFVHG